MWRWAWIAALLLWSLPSRAEAAVLVVTRDDGARACPDAPSLAAAVNGVAGRAVLAASPAPVLGSWIRVELTRTFEGYRAAIQVSGGRGGSRVITDIGPGCDNLRDAVAVALAILLDPVAETPTPQPAAVEPPAPAERVARAPRPTPSFGAEAAAGMAMGILPNPRPAVEIGARSRLLPRWTLSLGGTLLALDRAGSSAGQVELGLAYGQLRSCLSAPTDDRATAFELCVQPMLGALRGSGQGFEVEGSETLLWAALGGGAAAILPLARSWSLSFRATALAPLVHHGFSVSIGGAQRQVFSTPPLGGLLTFGLIYAS